MSTPLYFPRLLAEAVRAQLEPTPSDWTPGVGSFSVERAWLPIVQLQHQAEIVLTVLSADDQGDVADRSFRTQGTLDIDIGVQKLLSEDPLSDLGKQQIDAVCDFAQATLVRAFQPLTDAEGRRYVPVKYERAFVDQTLRNWNQVSVLMTITYRFAPR